MADQKTPTPTAPAAPAGEAPPAMQVETFVAPSTGTKAQTENGSEFGWGDDDGGAPVADGPDLGASSEGDGGAGDEGGADQAAEGGAGDAEPADDSGAADLPDFDASNEEVVAAYDARYYADGKLNIEGLSKEFWAGHAAGNKEGFDPKVYAYLENLGIPKTYIQQIADGEVARMEKADAGFYSKTGGKQRYEAALDWGKKGGYSAEQQARFQAAFEKGTGTAEFAEQVELLMTRFEGATGNRQRNGPRSRRPSSPRADATANAAPRQAAQVPKEFEGIKSRSDYQAAITQADTSVNSAKRGSKERHDAEQHLARLREYGRRSFSRMR